MDVIPPANPVFNKEMEEAAINALRNERYILGESVNKFEEDFAKYVGTDYAVSVSSGTNALHLALIAANITICGEIITPASSYIATANSILHANGTPVFCDINDEYLIDTNQISKKISKRTKGIMPVHLYGHPVDIDEINEIAKKNNLFVIEDCAQSHGAIYKGKMTGTFSEMGCFSFYSTKNMTVCGDGGMVTTNNDKTAETIKLLRNHGQHPKDVHTILGYTARLNTVNAAIGIVQLKYLPNWIEERRQTAKKYNNFLSDIEEVVLPPGDSKDKRPSYHLFELKVRKRDELIKFLRDNRIICLIHYPTPIPYQPLYKKMFGFKEGGFPKSEELSLQAMDLPMFPGLKDDQIKYISEKIHEFFDR
ncbi:MAG: DegT/DnrJ/EryC1/StrS family aminotransferase [Candidatus Hodarchaeales archaeon]|jgi:perosamine synthetase